jgi:hypothetical protein
LKSFSTVALTAASVLMSAGRAGLKLSPGVFFVTPVVLVNNVAFYVRSRFMK